MSIFDILKRKNQPQQNSEPIQQAEQEPEELKDMKPFDKAYEISRILSASYKLYKDGEIDFSSFYANELYRMILGMDFYYTHRDTTKNVAQGQYDDIRGFIERFSTQNAFLQYLDIKSGKVKRQMEYYKMIYEAYSVMDEWATCSSAFCTFTTSWYFLVMESLIHDNGEEKIDEIMKYEWEKKPAEYLFEEYLDPSDFSELDPEMLDAMFMSNEKSISRVTLENFTRLIPMASTIIRATRKYIKTNGLPEGCTNIMEGIIVCLETPEVYKKLGCFDENGYLIHFPPKKMISVDPSGEKEITTIVEHCEPYQSFKMPKPEDITDFPWMNVDDFLRVPGKAKELIECISAELETLSASTDAEDKKKLAEMKNLDKEVQKKIKKLRIQI